jgi:hypothetical protein
MSSDLNAQQQAHRDAVERLTQSRRMAKDALAEAEIKGLPGAVTIANDQPPTKASIRGSENYRRPAWADAAQTLHATTLSYWSEVRPYRQQVEGLWNSRLADIERPVQADAWREEKPTGKLPRRYRGVDYITRPLALSSLGRWRSKNVTLACHVERRHGDDIRKRREEDVFLPLLAASLVIETLDDVLAELGLLAEAGGGDTNNPPPI